MFDDILSQKQEDYNEIFKGMKAICINCLSDRTKVIDIVKKNGRDDFIIECEYCGRKFYLVEGRNV